MQHPSLGFRFVQAQLRLSVQICILQNQWKQDLLQKWLAINGVSHSCHLDFLHFIQGSQNMKITIWCSDVVSVCSCTCVCVRMHLSAHVCGVRERERDRDKGGGGGGRGGGRGRERHRQTETEIDTGRQRHKDIYGALHGSSILCVFQTVCYQQWLQWKLWSGGRKVNFQPLHGWKNRWEVNEKYQHTTKACKHLSLDLIDFLPHFFFFSKDTQIFLSITVKYYPLNTLQALLARSSNTQVQIAIHVGNTDKTIILRAYKRISLTCKRHQ